MAELRQGRARRAAAAARAVFRRLFADHAFDHAATLAFYFFLGMIPLLVVIGLLVGGIVQREGAASLAQPLLRAVPRLASDLVRQELQPPANADAGTIAPVSALGFLWLTTNGVHNLMDVFEQLVGATPRAWWRQRVIATVWVAAAVAAMAAATWVALVLDNATLVLAVFVASVGLGIATFYRTAIARPPTVRRRVWPGTLVAMGSWALVSWAFGAYVASIGQYAVYYGSLAAIAVILLWLYLGSLALLVGAEVNAVLETPPAP